MQATDRISIRTTPHTKSIIEQASQLMGVSLSSFILDSAYHKAMEVVKESAVITLNQQEWDNAMRMLDEPSDSQAAMQSLFERGFKVANP